jgi:hypothetical protein
MKRLILVFALTIVTFAVLLPFVSTTPDGVQKLTANSGSQRQPVWGGLMANYSIALGDPYISTLVAGLLGIGIIVATTFALGSIASRKKREDTCKSI